MAQTTQKDGSWNDTSVWAGGVLPLEGETIAINHNVVYNYDNSAMATGYGAITIAAGKSITASTVQGNYYLKMVGHISASGVGAEIRAGTSEVEYPSNCTFTVYWNGNYHFDCYNNNLTLKFYCRVPPVKYVKMLGSTPLTISGISRSSTCTVTSYGHGLSGGTSIYLVNVGGMVELDGVRVYVKTVLSPDTFTIRWLDQDIIVDSREFTPFTSGGYICQYVAESAGSTAIEVDTDVSGDPDWTRSGARIHVADVNRGWSVEDVYVSSIVGKTINLTAGLAANRSGGCYVALMTRNVQVLTAAVGITDGIVKGGIAGHSLGCSMIAGHANSGCGYLTHNATIPSGGVSCAGSNAYSFSGSNYVTVDGLICGAYGFSAGTNATINGLMIGVSYGFHAGHNYGTFTASSKFLAGGSAITSSSNHCCSFFGEFNNASTVCGSAGFGCVVADGVYRHINYVSVGGVGTVVRNVRAYSVQIGLSSANNTMADNCVFQGGTYGFNAGSILLTNCKIRDMYSNCGAIGDMYNTEVTPSLEMEKYNSLYGLRNYVQSFDHDQQVGAFRSWTRGGIVSSTDTNPPTGRVRCYNHVCESATYPCWHQREIVVDAGRQLRVRVWLKADVGVEVKSQLVLPTADPLITGSGTGEWQQIGTSDTAWHEYVTTWTNSATYPVTIYLRFLATAASGNGYSDFQWAFDRTPLVR